jgi:catechol 2,3-dioxygenase-like lactoylglutathione lyase family enzyme
MSNSTKGSLRMNQTRRNALKLLAAAIVLAPLAAQAQNPPTKSPPIHGLAHIAIRVNDIAASRAFYEKLGFQQAFDMEKNGTVTQSFIKVNDRQFIELYPKTDAAPTIGFLHLCFDGEDLNALHDFDAAQGLPPTAVRKAGAGNLLFTLRGPEDQNIEYTQYMPGSLHYEDRGKHLNPVQDVVGNPPGATTRITDSFYAVALGFKDVPAARAFYDDKLYFDHVAGDPNTLLIPGSKSDRIILQPLTTPASRIYLAVPSLTKTATELKKRGIPFTTTKKDLTVTDPDGNALIFTSIAVSL